MLNAAMFPQIAALLAQRQGQQMPTGQPPAAPSMPQQVKQRAYYGSIPEIAKAREADPRQLLANTALANGASTAPVAGGSWAWADGISRALSGVAGGYMNKQNDKKYADREAAVMEALKASAAMASSSPTGNAPLSSQQPSNAPNAHVGQGVPKSSMAIAAALSDPNLQGNGGGIAPAQSGQSFAEAFAPFGSTPPSGQIPTTGGVPGAPPPMMAPAPARTALAAPTPAPVASRRGLTANQGGGYTASDLYFKGIVPIEGGTDKNGRFLTSPKGAIGPGQVMPGTAPEAAKLAGVPFNDYKYRNDPEYNNLLGQAYYKKQLETFGGPVKAAAAYNAGPGRVTRALRRAARSGEDWTAYLPEETRKYVNSFKAKVSTSEINSSGQTIREDVTAVGPVPVAKPTMESVRELGQANYVPPEVESNRIRMAQQMLESGNPDMVMMAREYLDKGLSEQNTARLQRNNQQFDMGANERGLAFTDRANTQSRNFGREEAYTRQTFDAGENAATREQQARLASADQAFTREENTRRMSFEAEQAEAERAERKAQFEASNKGNPFFDTVGGRKLADDMYKEIDNNALAVSKYDRLLQLLDSGLQTGSMYAGYGSEELQQRFGGLNNDVGEFLALTNDTTLAKIGGSLGVAISDGDRTFIASSNAGLGKDEAANRNIALATIGALERKTDYTYARMEAEMGGPEALKAFNKNWRAFAEAENIVKYDNKGNVSSVTRKPVKFEEWLASRPKFDQNGNRIN